ncbi:MAG: peptidyl-prolyl cis-trans isomerase D [Paraglaciecola sp.]|jgi:peptidyl-prolyl cis-trans isomerase D
MLERIREGSQGGLAMGILGLVILSFVFAGVGSYINSPSDVAAATVNGDEVSKAALERAYENERNRMESQFGDAFATLASDAAYLQQFKQGILDRLIGEKLLDQTAQELGLRVSDEQIKQAIVDMQEFQVDGQFNNERYLALLRQAGFQASGFRDYMRVEMIRKQVSLALLGTEFALSNETQTAYQLQQQTRDARYLRVPGASFSEQVTLSEEQISDHYQKNIYQFDTEQQVGLAYVELSLTDLLPLIEVSEEEADEYYQRNLQNFRRDEERRASHILFESADDDEGLNKQAEEVLAKVQAGEDFASLAKTYSSDTFSAENGGDLDWFARGVMDPAFEEAAYALDNVGDISPVVKSEFGYHIIQLTDIKAQNITPFIDVKEQILSEVKTEKAKEEFYALQQRMAQVAFEMPDHLDEVAAIAGKSIEQTTLFRRNQAPPAVANGKVLNAAFSSELIDEGVNSDVIELADNHIMVVRVAKHEPERTQALDEVSSQIKTQLVAQASQEAAREWALAALSSLTKGEALALQDLAIEWQEQQAIPRTGSTVEQNIVEQLFKLGESADSDTAVVDLNNGDVGLVKLTKINQVAQADSTQLASLQRRLSSARAQFLYGDFIESLKAKADIAVYQ